MDKTCVYPRLFALLLFSVTCPGDLTGKLGAPPRPRWRLFKLVKESFSWLMNRSSTSSSSLLLLTSLTRCCFILITFLKEHKLMFSNEEESNVSQRYEFVSKLNTFYSSLCVCRLFVFSTAVFSFLLSLFRSLSPSSTSLFQFIVTCKRNSLKCFWTWAIRIVYFHHLYVYFKENLLSLSLTT